MHSHGHGHGHSHGHGDNGGDAERREVASALARLDAVVAGSVTSYAGGAIGHDPIRVGTAARARGLEPNIHLTCVSQDRRGLRKTLFESPEWTLVHWDDQGMIYLREDLRARDFASLTPYRKVNPDSQTVEALAHPYYRDAALAELRGHAQAHPEALRSRRKLS